jgi:hypothetical protein
MQQLQQQCIFGIIGVNQLPREPLASNAAMSLHVSTGQVTPAATVGL